MPRSRRRPQWLVPAGLVALSLVPVVAGAVRVGQLATHVPVTSQNARFVATPAPVVVHIVAASVFCILGALQFAPALRRRRWHRVSGRVVLPAGILAAMAGMWMAVFYDLPATDDRALEVMRLGFGAGMVVSLVLGLVAVRRRDFRTHRAWVMRGYAIGMGAGTQVLTTIPWVVVAGQPSATPRAVLLGAGWVINLVVAEYVIRRRPVPPVPQAAPRRAALSTVTT